LKTRKKSGTKITQSSIVRQPVAKSLDSSMKAVLPDLPLRECLQCIIPEARWGEYMKKARAKQERRALHPRWHLRGEGAFIMLRGQKSRSSSPSDSGRRPQIIAWHAFSSHPALFRLFDKRSDRKGLPPRIFPALTLFQAVLSFNQESLGSR
jgi:hypothetical protein